MLLCSSRGEPSYLVDDWSSKREGDAEGQNSAEKSVEMHLVGFCLSGMLVDCYCWSWMLLKLCDADANADADGNPQMGDHWGIYMHSTESIGLALIQGSTWYTPPTVIGP